MPRTKSFSAVVFDFDDTLVHLDVDWEAVERGLASFARHRGYRVRARHESLMAYTNVLSATQRDKHAVDVLLGRYEDLCVGAGRYHPLPHMTAVLSDAAQAGLRIAVASGNRTRTVRRVLGEIAPLRAVSVIMGRDRVRWTKPAPDIIHACVLALKTTPSETAMIGDSKNDTEAAAAAGVRCFRIKSGGVSDGAAVRDALGIHGT